MTQAQEGKHIYPIVDESTCTHTPIDELYWRAIRALTLPEIRHYGHTDDLEEVIYYLMLEKELLEPPLTRQHEALLVRVRTTWANADYGFTFGPVAPTPRQPPPPPPDASPEEIVFLEGERKRLADLNAYLPTYYAKWQTLDDVRPDDLRKMVVAIQNILPDESVARCMEAIMRAKDIPGAFTWLGQNAKK